MFAFLSREVILNIVSYLEVNLIVEDDPSYRGVAGARFSRGVKNSAYLPSPLFPVALRIISAAAVSASAMMIQGFMLSPPI